MSIVISIVPWRVIAAIPEPAITEASEPASSEITGQALAEAPEPASAEEQSINPVFNDVSPNDWFYDPVMYAVKNNIFSGTGNNNFSPYSPMTRAMFVTVLGRIAGIGSDYPVQEGLFSDVKSDA